MKLYIKIYNFFLLSFFSNVDFCLLTKSGDVTFKEENVKRMKKVF